MEREKYVNRTNAERIRSMSDEELARWITKLIEPGYFNNDRYYELWLVWLKSKEVYDGKDSH